MAIWAPDRPLGDRRPRSPPHPRRATIDGVDDELDPHTLRKAAELVRLRMASTTRNPRLDGLEKLGATRVLKQLAIDLDVSADHVGPRRRHAGKRQT